MDSPLPPLCDMECQRKKQLAALKHALDTTTDPAGHEQARINYYTALKGQGWLANEKQSTAANEIKPRLQAYSSKFKELKEEKQKHQTFSDLIQSIQADDTADDDETLFLRKRLGKEKDKVSVLDRLNQLGNPQVSTTYSYLPYILDGLLVLLGLVLVYMLYSKFDKIRVLFGFRSDIPSFTETDNLS